MPLRYSWSDVVSSSNLAFQPNTRPKQLHVVEMLDALAKYRATYKYSDMSLIGWWWHRSSKYEGSPNYYNGWTRSGSSMGVSVSSTNVLQLKPTSTSAYMQSALLNTYPPVRAYPAIGGTGHRYLIMKIRSTVALSNLQLQWTTTSATGTWRSQVLPTVPGTNQWTLVEFDLGSNANWTGSLRQLRLYPNVSGGTIEIDYLLIDKEDLRTSSLDTNFVKAIEITNIRKWAARANGNAGSSASVSWTDATLTAGGTVVKAIHYKEIRDQIDSAYGKNRGWVSNCDGYICTCDTGCHSYTSSTTCSCNYSCHGYGSCSCDNTCHGYTSSTPCSCNSTCYGYVACSCNNTCHGYKNPVSCTCNNRCHGYSSCTCDYECYSEGGCDCDYSCYSDSCGCDGSYEVCSIYDSGWCDDDWYCSCDGSCDSHSCWCYDTCHWYSSDCTGDNECYGYEACSCNSKCHGYVASAPCSCDSTCYGYKACTCNSKCHGYSATTPCSCNNTCYGYSSCSCNSTCYGYIASVCSCNKAKDNITCYTCDQYAPGA